MQIVADMVKSFPNGGSRVDQQSYSAKLAATLMEYPPCIARKASDPVRGVPGTTEFLPTPCTIIKWAERERGALEEIVRRDDVERKTIEDRQAQVKADAKLTVARASRPPLDKLKERFGPRWGPDRHRRDRRSPRRRL
jgi:hypothetical protein